MAKRNKDGKWSKDFNGKYVYNDNSIPDVEQEQQNYISDADIPDKEISINRKAYFEAQIKELEWKEKSYNHELKKRDFVRKSDIETEFKNIITRLQTNVLQVSTILAREVDDLPHSTKTRLENIIKRQWKDALGK